MNKSFHSAGQAPAPPPLPRGGRGEKSGFPLTQEGHCGPLTRRCLRLRRPLPPGERRTGFLLAQESHCGPLTRRCLRLRRPLPRWGEAYWTAACAGRTQGGGTQGGLDSRFRRNDTGGREGHIGLLHSAKMDLLFRFPLPSESDRIDHRLPGTLPRCGATAFRGLVGGHRQCMIRAGCFGW